MKAILISIQSPHACNILNLIKLWEIRKKFPKDYVGWVYIYCCAEDKNGYLIRNKSTKKMEYTYNGFVASICWLANRKVVARFWCDKVEDYVYGHKWSWENGAPMWGADNSYEAILKDMCLNDEELRAYVDDLCFSAIHITKLEIFDEPKEISEFWGIGKKCKHDNMIDREWYCEYCKKPDCIKPLTRAPQSYCYIEV